MTNEKYFSATLIDGWASGKSWIVATLILLVFLVISALYVGNQGAFGVFTQVDMTIHQFGHAITGSLGEVGQAISGTILQLGLPLAIVLTLRSSQWFFGAMMALMWLSINIFEVAAYVRDATLMQLTYSGIGAHGTHDWTVVLDSTGSLSSAGTIATLLTVLGFFLWFYAAARAGWLVYKMYIYRKNPPGYASP